MSFITVEFVFLYLPICIMGFLLAQRQGLASIWLVSASIIFYAFSSVTAVCVVFGSVTLNYLLSLFIFRITESRNQTFLLSCGIATNLFILGYFKYFGFLEASLGNMLDTNFVSSQIILPLGISFFTFQQIAYLIDLRTKKSPVPRFKDYLLFVMFFPQAASGPINYWYETIPQYRQLDTRVPTALDVSVGLTFFSFGFFKKTVFAGSLGQFVDPVFATPASDINIIDAWTAALAFMLLLYFDFSGYSDMAIGIARLFGIRLPINFDSPYKASSLADFWRRWHMTMTRFFTDYVYSPLALRYTRQTMMRGDPKHVQFLLSIALPIIVTFLLIGWWHGPQWTYLVFGAVNALGLIINQMWRTLKFPSPPTFLSWLITMAFIMLSMVLFRAPTLQYALAFYHSMLGGNLPSLAALPHELLLALRFPLSQNQIDLPLLNTLSHLIYVPIPLLYLILLVIVCVGMPNTVQIMVRYDPEAALTDRFRNYFGWLNWRPNLIWAIIVGIILIYGLTNIPRVREFIYVQF